MKYFIRYIKALFIVAGRAEYFSADITPFLIGCFLASNMAHWDVSIFLVSLLVVVLAHYAAVWANVISDYELDKKYKCYLPEAVDFIGKNKLIFCIIVASLIGTILCLYLSLILGSFCFLVLWMLGLTSALVYTLEPIRLKKYPLIGDFARGFPIIIPMVFGYLLFNSSINLVLSINFIGIAINLLGLFLIGEVWDYKDDKGFVKTVAVVSGYKKCVYVGGILIIVGLLFWLSYYSIHFMSYLFFRIYVLISIILIFFFVALFYYRVIRQISYYNRIEGFCGKITKIGTTFMWAWQLVGAILMSYMKT